MAGRRPADVSDGSIGARLRVPGDGLPAGDFVVRVTGETFEAAWHVVVPR